jgi:hypothetical protein
MNSNPSRRSSLFLLELMIAIMFFCLCSAVCVRLFVQSHIISRDTQNLNMAMNETTNLAELFRGEDDFFDAFAAAYPEGELDTAGGSFTIYYDADWTVCKKADAVYAVTAAVTADDNGLSGNTGDVGNTGDDDTSTLWDAGFTAQKLSDPADNKADDIIYQLTTKKYMDGGYHHE